MQTDFRVYPNVTIGPDASLSDFVIIGFPPVGFAAGQLPTILGARALIRSHSVVYAGNSIGDDFQTGHGVMIREQNEIGDHVSVGTHSIIEHHVKIGDHVRIHSNVFIPEYSVLENECWIGPNVVFTNARYPLSPGAKTSLKGPYICSGAIIGANVTLLPGIEIGSSALVGAGAVVIQDVPAGAVVVGNPARIVNSRVDLAAYQV